MNEWTPLTTLFKEPVLHRYKVGYDEKCTCISRGNFKMNQQELSAYGELMPGLKVFLRLRTSPDLAKIFFFPGAKQHSPRNSQWKEEGASLPFWSWLLRHSSPHHHSCRRLGCWWSHSSCPPWKAEQEKSIKRLRVWTWTKPVTICQKWNMKTWRSHIVCNITNSPEKQEIIIPLSLQSRQKKKDTKWKGNEPLLAFHIPHKMMLQEY